MRISDWSSDVCSSDLGWYSTNILGNRDGEVLDDPENFKSKEVSKLGVIDTILQPDAYPDLYGNVDHVVRINYYQPRGDNKEGWDRSEEHTSELQSLMRISYAVFCLKKKKQKKK